MAIGKLKVRKPATTTTYSPSVMYPTSDPEMQATTPGGKMRTDRHNNPTAFTTDVARNFGLVEGRDFVQGDPFGGGKYYTAKLLGDPINTTIRALDYASSTGIGAFTTSSGKKRWSYETPTDDQWIRMTPEQKRNVIAQMYKREGGSGELLSGGSKSSLLNNFTQKVEQSRQIGKTDTEILDYLAQRDPSLAPKIEASRRLKDDREIVNYLSQNYGGAMPKTPSVPTQGQSNESQDGLLKTFGKAMIESEVGLGKTFGAALTKFLKGKQIDEAQKQMMSDADKLAQLAMKTTDPEQKKRLLNGAENQYKMAGVVMKDVYGEDIYRTSGQRIGDVAGVMLDVATAGTYGRAKAGYQTAKLMTKSKLASGIAGQLGLKTTAPTILKEALGTMPKASQTMLQRASGIGKEALKNIPIGAGIGYGYDVSMNLQQGKEGADIFKPGFGTLIGGGIPVAIGGVKLASLPISGVYRVARSYAKPTQKMIATEQERVASAWSDVFKQRENTASKLDFQKSQGKDPEKVLSNYVPDTEYVNGKTIIKTKVDGGVVDQISEDIGIRGKQIQETLDKIEQINPLEKKSITELENEAIGYATKEFSGLELDSTINKIKSIGNSIRTKYGDNIGIGSMNRERVSSNSLTKAWLREQADLDAFAVWGNVFRNQIDNLSGSKIIRDVNKEIGELIAARKMAILMDGKNVGGGRFTNIIASAAGALLGGMTTPNQGIVVSLITSLASALGVKTFLRYVQSGKFGGAATKRILQALEKDQTLLNELLKQEPEMVGRAFLRMVNKKYGTELKMLPAPQKGAFRSEIKSGKVIGLPSKTTTAKEAEEIARLGTGGRTSAPMPMTKALSTIPGGNQGNIILPEKIPVGLRGTPQGQVKSPIEVRVFSNPNKPSTLSKLKNDQRGFIKTGDSLIQEAKGKSLEEFLKAQPTYYHTTKLENVPNIEKQGFSGEIGEMSKASGGAMEKGVFLYPEKSSADVFGKNFKNPSVIETKVNGKVYDANTQTKYGWEDDLQTQEIAKDKNIIAQLKKDGYVGVKSTELGTDAIFVFDNNAVKTKSQLTDIWNKAQGKRVGITPPKKVAIKPTPETSLIQEAKKYKSAEEFVKAQVTPVAQHKLLGDIKDIEGIKTNGFREGFNVNALPIYGGGNPSNVIDTRYGPKKGDTMILVPKNQLTTTPNGYKVKKGYKPTDAEIVKIKYDFQSPLEARKSQLTEIWNKANKATPKQSLIQEAKKYKSAEEYGNAIKEKFIKEQCFKPSSMEVVNEWWKAKQTQPYIGIGGSNPEFFANKPTVAELPKSELSKYLKFTDEGKAIYYRGIPEDVKTRGIRWGDFLSPDKGKASFYGNVERYELDPKYVKQLGDLEAVYFNPADKLKAPEPKNIIDIWNKANATMETSLIQEAKKIEKQAIDTFYETKNPKEALFITSDGKYIDGTGKNQVGESERKYMTDRIVDHREVAQEFSDKSGSDALIDYMNKTGNVRMSMQSDGTLNIDISVMPTEQQLKSIEKAYLNGGRKPIIADISDSNGGIISSGEFKTFQSYKDFLNKYKDKLPDIWNKENKKTVGLKPPKKLLGVTLGIQPDIQKDEKGNITFKGIKFDPKMATIGMIGGVAITKLPTKKINPAKITTKILDDLGDRATVSKQFIMDLTNKGDVKQVEKDLIRGLLEKESDKIDVPLFSQKVRDELLPLNIKRSGSAFLRNKTADDYAFSPRYKNISLPDELRGNVRDYREKIYESPIKTSAGEVHFMSTSKNYFGHTRIEDMAVRNLKEIDEYNDIAYLKDGSEIPIKDASGNTRRVIEVQSDLYQKGMLETSIDEGWNPAWPNQTLEEAKTHWLKSFPENSKKFKELVKRYNETRPVETYKKIQKLQQYNDPTAHFRMVREEVKQAAIDGKTKLQFPTGETAMKIEGLGEVNNFFPASDIESGGGLLRASNYPITINDLSIGKKIVSVNNNAWIITDVLGDGKFKAVPKLRSGDVKIGDNGEALVRYESMSGKQIWKEVLESDKETFDISGKVDKENPIYKFYEKDLGKYLSSKYQAKRITDNNGVSWYEIDVNPEWANKPVQAFGMTGGVAGFEQDEEGKWRYNVKKGLVGLVGGVAATKVGSKATNKSKMGIKPKI